MDLVKRFQGIIGSEDVITDPAALATYGTDWLNAFPPAPRCALRPRTTAEVAQIVQLCCEHEIPLVPSGGRTGLSGGAAAPNGEVVLSLERMTTIAPPDTIDRTVECEGGAITERVQQVAREAGLYFPVDFASRGSSRIGGNIATNAGGLRVLRYGNMRDWVLGLTVVTGTGEILNLNGKLFKNNSGFDLRALLIGSEGTLGIITAAVLKLTAPPGPATRIFCGLTSSEELPNLLSEARRRFESITLFEFMSRAALEVVKAHHPVRDPFTERYETYALLDIEGDEKLLRGSLEGWLADLAERGVIADAVIAQSAAQAADFLALRELISSTLSRHYTIHKNDIAVPVPAVPQFLRSVATLAPKIYPGAQIVSFGHLGDGNIHFNVIKPEGMPPETFLSQAKVADDALFTLVRSFAGTVSAEHGVGLLKKDYLHYTRSAGELAIMRSIKRAFDPKGILSPGKVFDVLPHEGSR